MVPVLISQNDTVLAFDYGEKRIGVAVGNLMLRQSHPLTTIVSEVNATRFAAIEKLILEWQPVRLVVGLPLTLDGEEHKMTLRCKRFANRLHGRFNLPVDMADERLTSVEADAILGEQGMPALKRKQHLDALAAQILLQGYLETIHHAA